MGGSAESAAVWRGAEFAARRERVFDHTMRVRRDLSALGGDVCGEVLQPCSKPPECRFSVALRARPVGTSMVSAKDKARAYRMEGFWVMAEVVLLAPQRGA
jgi:hydrogenase maturation factor